MSYQNAPEFEPRVSIPGASSNRKESNTKLECSVHDVDEGSVSDALNWERARSVTKLELILALLFSFPFGLLRGDRGLWNKSVFLAFWRLLSDQMIEPDRFRPALALWSATVGVLLLLFFLVLRITTFFLIIAVYFLINAILLMCYDCFAAGRARWRRKRILYEGI